MECGRQGSNVLLKCCALHTFDVIDGQRQNMHAGLSLRAGGRGFSPATKRVAPGYFYWKIVEK